MAKTTCEISDTECVEEYWNRVAEAMAEAVTSVARVKECYADVVGGSPAMESMDPLTFALTVGPGLIDALPPYLLEALKVCAGG